MNGCFFLWQLYVDYLTWKIISSFKKQLVIQEITDEKLLDGGQY